MVVAWELMLNRWQFLLKPGSFITDMKSIKVKKNNFHATRNKCREIRNKQTLVLPTFWEIFLINLLNYFEKRMLWESKNRMKLKK